ncbi:MAG: hypothetical protein KGH94_02640 [Candidatus Micrarchaeota archaeon]|nr:hypothetical protein [Candidatus Micrarchaeota archaeon]
MMIPLFMLDAPTAIPGVEAGIGPLIFAALLLDVAIVSVWYFIGVILANEGVKQSAKGEYYQFLGTAFLIAILLWLIATYSGISNTVLSANPTGLLGSGTMSTMCQNIESSNQLNILGSTNSLLSGAQTPSGEQLVGICNMLDGTTTTDQMNYLLASTAVVTANLTAQTANNLNSAYTYDAYLGFLSNLRPVLALCFAPGDPLPCLVPGGALIGEYFRMSLTYQPFAGYSMLLNGMGVLGTLLNLAFESYVAQLLMISVLLYIWPYLLFGGIVLRSTFFTRKIGGLLIAVALGAVIVFPTVFLIEYATLGNGLPGISATSPYNVTYGFNASSPNTNIHPIPAVTVENGNQVVGNYILNFYVPPNLQQIAQANNCWPSISTAGYITELLNPAGPGLVLTQLSGIGPPNPLAEAELADIFYLLNPLTNLGSGAGQLISAGVTQSSGTYFLPAYCPVDGALATNLEMLNAYGVIGVTSYFLPLLNLIITLSAIIGLSGLMGGNTTLEGLSRFI